MIHKTPGVHSVELLAKHSPENCADQKAHPEHLGDALEKSSL